MAQERLDQPWHGGETDHDKIIRLSETISNLREKIEKLEKDNETLMLGRAWLIGGCAGVSGAVAIIVKIFWPK
jgi:hypothetical protein